MVEFLNSNFLAEIRDDVAEAVEMDRKWGASDDEASYFQQIYHERLLDQYASKVKLIICLVKGMRPAKGCVQNRC